MNHSTFDVIVLGGGAAGLFCALTAAKRGRSVLVLEKANKVGKKILMSGGGRCNFTNYIIEPENYISHNPHFCKSALKQFTQWDFIGMVEKYRISYEERKHSQLFCIQSANDILQMLLSECDAFGVKIETMAEVNHVSQREDRETPDKHTANKPPRYAVTFQQKNINHTISCHSLVVATGALSIPTLGGSGLGYDIATQFGLALFERRAGLVPFMFSDAMKSVCERLSGVSLDVEITCNVEKTRAHNTPAQTMSFRESLLFTHRGMSGPAVLQISNYWNPGEGITINLLPDEDATTYLLNAKSENPKSLLVTALSHRLGKAIAKELQQLWWQTMAAAPLAEFSDKKLADIGKLINQWHLKPSSTEGYRTAEVTLGGVNTDEVSSKTMEVKTQPGLFFIGEVMDVTGHLGGFNFQWAWSSGYVAGSFV